MNWLAENSLIIWMLGAIALTMALIVYFQTRTNGALLGILGVIGVTAALLLASWVLETPREAIERSLYELAKKVEANDVMGALSYLSPTASPKLRKDIETLMPDIKIDLARIIGEPETEVEAGRQPASATQKCRGIVHGTEKKSGMKVGGQDDFVLKWVRRGDRWLIESYTSKEDWPAEAAKRHKPAPM